MMADEVKKRGGARPGCGRKAKAFDEKTSEIFHLRLTVDEIEDLREYAIKHNCSMAVAMRARCFPKKRRKLLKK